MLLVAMATHLEIKFLALKGRMDPMAMMYNFLGFETTINSSNNQLVNQSHSIKLSAKS